MLNDHNIPYVLPPSDEAEWKFLENIDLICEWGVDRNITEEGGATALSQTKKMAEELQEFIDAKTHQEAVDAIGDMFVVLVQMARLRGIYLTDAVQCAYNEIKHRRGRMENGIFIKEQDAKDNTQNVGVTNL